MKAIQFDWMFAASSSATNNQIAASMYFFALTFGPKNVNASLSFVTLIVLLAFCGRQIERPHQNVDISNQTSQTWYYIRAVLQQNNQALSKKSWEVSLFLFVCLLFVRKKSQVWSLCGFCNNQTFRKQNWNSFLFRFQKLLQCLGPQFELLSFFLSLLCLHGSNVKSWLQLFRNSKPKFESLN